MTDRPEDDDDSLEITLRPAAEVAARLVALATVVRRAALELDPSGDAEGERFDMAAWLREEHVTPLLTADERRLIETRVGGLAQDIAEDASWRIESVAVLAWAAGLNDELPTYELPSPPAGILALIPEPWDKVQPFRAEIELRGEEEVAAAREQAELWQWRGQLLAGPDGDALPATPEMRQIIREVAADSARAGLFERSLSNDFPVAGRPYRNLTEDERALLTDLASERLRALNWLCGFGSSWDDAPTDIE